MELGARHDEIAARVAHLKQLVKADAISQTPTAESAAETEKLVAELEDTDRRSKVLAAERDELNTALTELREAFQSVRDVLMSRQELESEVDERGEAEQQHLQQSLTDRTDELQQVQARLSDRDNDVAELQQKLAERDELLPELQARMGGSDEVHKDAAQIRVQHAELDERIAVLDQREENSREQERRIENTEEELEGQRLQLREARQQLELARAELQTTPDTQPQSMHDEHTAILSEESLDTASTESTETANGGDRASIRSELAEMFGLGGDEDEASSGVAELQPLGVDDGYVEVSDAVSLSFSGVESVLLEASADVPEETVDETAASDEFVADYMEQLLARNRQKAGGTLPEELAPESSSSATNAASAAAAMEPQVPQTRSFIDAYNAGDFDSQTSASGLGAEPSPDTKKAIADRPKIDLAALRNDMESFRALSTQSIENALAVHAKRKERSGIAARSTLFLVLAVICVFMISAVLTNVIPLGLIVWVSVAAVAVSGIELLAKICAVNSRVKRTAVVSRRVAKWSLLMWPRLNRRFRGRCRKPVLCPPKRLLTFTLQQARE